MSMCKLSQRLDCQPVWSPYEVTMLVSIQVASALLEMDGTFLCWIECGIVKAPYSEQVVRSGSLWRSVA